jgi:cell filamentation protein
MVDPYVYQGTNILKNKLNIRNQERLDQYESAVFQLSFLRLIKSGYKITRVLDILDLHKELFAEVYDWAGTIRTINIVKREEVLNGLSVTYGDCKTLKKDLERINDRLLKIERNSNFVSDITRLIADIWQSHPFREGNTRTGVVFLYFLLKRYEIDLNVDFLERHSKYFRNALVLASIGEYSEFNHLEKIMSEALCDVLDKKRKKNKSIEKYDTIKGIDLKKYKSNYHSKI